MDYLQIDHLLTGRCKASRKLANHTYLKRREDHIALRLHETDVVKFYPDHMEAYTGGWYTRTTMDRITDYIPGIHTVSHVWYMPDGSLFYEGVKVDYTGRQISKSVKPEATVKKTDKLKKRINTYCQKVRKALEKGIEVPGGGDCWHCVMKTEEGKTMGDISDPAGHLMEHIRQGYVVPALIWNSVKEAGYPYPEIIIGYRAEGEKSRPESTYMEGVIRSVKKYMIKRLDGGSLMLYVNSRETIVYSCLSEKCEWFGLLTSKVKIHTEKFGGKGAK